MSRALIKVGYGCNDHCTFCHSLEDRGRNDDGRRVAAKIDRAADLGHSMAVLSGGEPTIRPELMAWARHTRRRGLGFGLVTNGRMLAYGEKVEALLAEGLGYVYLSLHGGSAAIHDACVRAEAFEQSYGAARNLAGRGLDFTVNCVVCKTNLEHLDALVDLLAPLEGVRLTFSMTEAKGGADQLFDSVVPRVSEVAAAVAAVIARGRQVAPGLPLLHGGIPFCLLPGLEDRHSDLRSHGFASMSEVWEDDFFPVDNRNTVQPAPCQGCRHRGACPGLYTAYHQRHGDGELRPEEGPRSNAFHYVPQRALAWPEGAPCPVLEDGPSPYDRGRHLLLLRGESLIAHHTRTRDFADLELEAIKDALGQVYLDRSTKDAPDDFAADLQALEELPVCATCPVTARCTHAFRAIDEPVFERDDARLRERLGSLEGEILDIGCGDARYGEVFASGAAAGRLRYWGIDPDAARLEELARRWPWATLEATSAEALELAEASLDHVLVLRAFNHLREPREVLARAARALKPEGSLLLVDNVAFGLVRTHEQAERGERGEAVFEHYRNADDREALALAEGLPLQLVHQESISPGTSNQWVLHFRRT
ncbi:MAG: radical SAM protein [Deltaproteobacteria bacterium]|nr:radical SAM protein [Deltaproteobacteria bacterium]